MFFDNSLDRKTKLNYFLFVVVFITTSSMVAQSASPNIISTSGTSFNDGTTQWDYTLGEPATATFSDGTTLLTQGYHQPNLIITSINNTETSYTVTVFPNPTNDVLQLHLDKLNASVTIEIFAADGKLIYSQHVDAPTDLQIKMSDYPSGAYLLSVQDESSKQKTYRIVKIN